MKSTVLEDLDRRGLIFQITHDELDETLQDSQTLYCGFDPTADSLHAGSLLLLMGLANFRRHGHKPVALVGGATGLIGDPTGKSDERVLLTDDILTQNADALGIQIRTILDRAMGMHTQSLVSTKGTDIPIVNNADWMKPWSFIDFLRDVGKHFRVNAMMQKDSVKSRLNEREQGISYTEFSYMLIQAYDFYHLLENEGCVLQIGGSDQWGNITAGTDLIRRRTSKSAYGLTFPLLMTADGKKMGKTESGALWLDANKTKPYVFYQYWVGRDDSQVVDLLKKFTFISVDEIDEMAKADNRGELQRRLAYELTWLVHGKDVADTVVAASKMLFGAPIENLSDEDLASLFADVPSTQIKREDLENGIGLLQLFSDTGLQKSNGAARRLVEQGGAYINNNRISDTDRVVTMDDLASESMLVLRAGKKKYHLISVS